MKHEFILTVMREFVNKLNLPQGQRVLKPATDNVRFVNYFSQDSLPYLAWIQREFAEKNSKFLQILPYIVLRDKNNMLFAYQRTKGIGEDRLLGKKSIGLGGHVDMSSEILHDMLNGIVKDSTIYYSMFPVVRCISREMQEELADPTLLNDFNETPVAFLFDDVQLTEDTQKDKVSVGRVHLGVVFEYLVDDVTAFDLAETELIKIDPIDLTQAWRTDDFEPWSQMLLSFYRLQFINDRLDKDAWKEDVEKNENSYYVYTDKGITRMNMSSAAPASVPGGVMDQTPWMK